MRNDPERLAERIAELEYQDLTWRARQLEKPRQTERKNRT